MADTVTKERKKVVKLSDSEKLQRLYELKTIIENPKAIITTPPQSSMEDQTVDDVTKPKKKLPTNLDIGRIRYQSIRKNLRIKHPELKTKDIALLASDEYYATYPKPYGPKVSPSTSVTNTTCCDLEHKSLNTQLSTISSKVAILISELDQAKRDIIRLKEEMVIDFTTLEDDDEVTEFFSNGTSENPEIAIMYPEKISLKTSNSEDKKPILNGHLKTKIII